MRIKGQTGESKLKFLESIYNSVRGTTLIAFQRGSAAASALLIVCKTTAGIELLLFHALYMNALL